MFQFVTSSGGFCGPPAANFGNQGHEGVVLNRAVEVLLELIDQVQMLHVLPESWPIAQVEDGSTSIENLSVPVDVLGRRMLLGGCLQRRCRGRRGECSDGDQPHR